MILRSLLVHPLAGLAGIAFCFTVLAVVDESGDAALGAAYVAPTGAAGYASARLARTRGRLAPSAAGWAALTTTVIVAVTLALMLVLLVGGFMSDTSS